MLKSEEIRRQVAQRLRELLPKAKSWEEQTDVKIAGHAAGLVVRFRLVDQEHTVVLEVASLGQPRQIRAAVTRSEEHTSELQSLAYLVCRLLLEKKKHNQDK